MQTPGWEDTGSGWVRSLVFLGRGGGYSRVQCIVIIDSLHLFDKYSFVSHQLSTEAFTRETYQAPKKYLDFSTNPAHI